MVVAQCPAWLLVAGHCCQGWSIFARKEGLCVGSRKCCHGIRLHVGVYGGWAARTVAAGRGMVSATEWQQPGGSRAGVAVQQLVGQHLAADFRV